MVWKIDESENNALKNHSDEICMIREKVNDAKIYDLNSLKETDTENDKEHFRVERKRFFGCLCK